MNYYDQGFAAYLNGLRHGQVLRHVQGLGGEQRSEFTRGFFAAKELDAITAPAIAQMHATGRTRAGNDIGGI